MAYLKIYSNAELQTLYLEAQSKGLSEEQLLSAFGKPPFHFLGPETGPVARYNDFQPMYDDRNGIQYTDIEEGVIGVKIPIGIRRKNPDIVFPQPGETVDIIHLQDKTIRQIYVISTQVNRTRRATAWLQVSG